ncbi:MAG: carboxypeptidase-like regulatory domain-containing protein, partial [Terracidiphilus sp.]
MSIRRLLALSAAFALLLQPIAAHAQPPATFQIAGRVVNSLTGAPVPRATVSALAEEDNRVVATATTDAEGGFSIAGLAAGKYPLTASRRGFRTAYFDEHEDSFNTAIVTGPNLDTGHLVFKLAPGAVIYGTVTSDGGDPVENAQVVLFRRDPAAPKSNPTRAQDANTDDIGAYEFSDLPAGQYLVAVGAQPWYAMHHHPGEAQSGDNSLDVAYPVTFFDSTTDEASASPLDVAAGERAEADISLHAVPALHIKLTGLRQPNDGPVAHLQQTVFGAEFPAQADMEGNANGYEFVGLAPGHYELETANPPRTTDLDASSSMEIDPSSGTPMQPIDGTVRMADGSPPGNVMLALARSGSVGDTVNAYAQAGQFHFAAVPPGVWTLTAGGGRSAVYVASVTAAGSPVSASQIAVRDHPLTLAVTLSRSQ